MLHFYVLSAILVTLGLLKLLLNGSTFSTLISIFLKCCLCYCVFQTFFTLLLVDQECVLLSLNQLGFKAIDCNLSNNDPSVCFSPAEDQVIKNRLVAWIASWLGAFTVLSIIQIPWVILKKLDYTQEVIKRLTARGWPNWLFFFVRHSNPGPVGGEPLFRLLIGILVGNVVLLYILMRIIYLLS